MFSIEHTLEEIINFFKSFFYTVYVIVLKPSGLLTFDEKKKMKAPIYVLLCAFLFLAMCNTTSNFWFSEANLQLSQYFGFFDEKLISERILYIIPFGIIIYALVSLASSVIKNDTQKKSDFKTLSYYWIGTSLLGYVVLILLYLLIRLMLPEGAKFDPDAYPKVSWEERLWKFINWRWHICILVPLVLSIVSVAINNKTRKQAILTFIIVPIIAAFSVIFCSYFLFCFLRYTELTKNEVVLLNPMGNNEIIVDTVHYDNTVESINVSTDILIQNKREFPMILRKDTLVLGASSRKLVDTDATYLRLRIQKIDNDSIAQIRVLKRGDFVWIHCCGMVLLKEFNQILKFSDKEKEMYTLQVSLPLSSSQYEENKIDFGAEKKVYLRGRQPH